MDSENVTSLGENLFQAVAFFSMPLVQTFAIAVLAATLAAFLFIGLREKAQTARNEEPATLTGLRVLAVLLAPIWLLIVGYILRSLGAMAMDFDATLNNTKDGTELRWHVLGFVGLITALGALVSAPLALIRVWTTERQTRTSEQGHMTDRISKAVEQLGAEKMVKDAEGERTVPNIEVRIGGLLSLERIAQDSTRYDKGRDHVRVMEILCAYVRENAPASGAVDSIRKMWEESQWNFSLPSGEEFKGREGLHEDVGVEEYLGIEQLVRWADSLPSPRADIAIALRVIGRRSAEQIQVEAQWKESASAPMARFSSGECQMPVHEQLARNGTQVLSTTRCGFEQCGVNHQGYRIDLRRTNLQRADLGGLVFAGAKLVGARLEGAFLRKANLFDADLTMARLEGAVLGQALLVGANLRQAHIEGARMQEVRLNSANLSEAHFDGARLGQADLTNADCSRACFDETRLGQATMTGIKNLAGATFKNAAFKDLSLIECPIAQEQLGAAFGDTSVILPGCISAPYQWPKWELPYHGEHNFHDEWREWQSDPDNYTPPPPPE